MVMGVEGPSVHGPTPVFNGPIPAKPVVYLYTEEAFELDLGVSFASGGATEVWPTIELGPELLWEGLQVAPGPCAATPFPEPWDQPGDQPGFCEACDLQRSVVADAACVTYGDQVSPLVFYTGQLPDYTAPLQMQLEVDGDGAPTSFVASNVSDRPVEHIWAIYRSVQDSCVDPSLCPVVSASVAWAYIPSVEPGERANLPVELTHLEVPVDEHGFPQGGGVQPPAEWAAIGLQLEAVLQERGLYAAEAQAFRANWDRVFLGLMGSDAGFSEPLYSNGALAFYMLPAEQPYGGQLPLTMDPLPTEQVRVGMVYDPFMPE